MGQANAPGSDSDSGSRTDSGTGQRVMMLFYHAVIEIVLHYGISARFGETSAQIKKNRQTGLRLGKISLSLPILCTQNTHCTHQLDLKGIPLNAGTVT